MPGSAKTSSATRLALVTGGGSGIGKSVCHALASEGTCVIVADINLDAAITTASSLPGSHQHYAFKVDVGCSTSVNSLFETIRETCGRPLNIAVNSAGIGLLAKSIIDTSEEDFDNVVRVNLKGTFLVTQAAARSMIAGKVTDGTIVNMSSMVAKKFHKDNSTYSATKAGVLALTKVVSKELASHGIRVNVVLPSFIKTPMPLKFFSPEFLSQAVDRITLGRAGLPEEVAEVVKFLCNSGSSFMVGSAVDVCGGLI
ncbi:estradiol 17-beta-dehydrogenase 8-like [Ixodes scapularis]|uniref:estradiol 17-beta-dehydrogenase 8-like n=1 Tax=Ixodes scapularis TaxID=6945 RepID=UPI001A9EF6FB|nr:estradiol 17-beta-dehydrogenase 8-like [Ixodes scapularis]